MNIFTEDMNIFTEDKFDKFILDLPILIWFTAKFAVLQNLTIAC